MAPSSESAPASPPPPTQSGDEVRVVPYLTLSSLSSTCVAGKYLPFLAIMGGGWMEHIPKVGPIGWFSNLSYSRTDWIQC
jgi:hypothetical protein